MFNLIKWLLTKEEPATKETAMNETPVTNETPAVKTENPVVTTDASTGATETPAVTTDASAVTTVTPAVVTETPAVVTETPAVVTETPVVTTETPAVATETPAVTTENPDASNDLLVPDAESNTEPVAAVEDAPDTTAEDSTPVAKVKAGVKDFDAALDFVERGLAQLGEAAKDELKTLVKKISLTFPVINVIHRIQTCEISG